MPTPGRDTANFRRRAAAFRRDCARINAPCWLCAQAIDYAAPRDDANSYTTDHIRPLSLHPDLAEDPANFAPAHRRCNEARGNRAPLLNLGIPSRRW